MANKTRTTFQKLQKERARQQKQRDKAARRLEAKQLKRQAAQRGAGADALDISGILPGPQPLPTQLQAVDEE